MGPGEGAGAFCAKAGIDMAETMQMKAMMQNHLRMMRKSPCEIQLESHP
jgi:hypothetical protein